MTNRYACESVGYRWPLRSFGFKGKSRYRLWRQDKGQQNCMNRFIETREQGLPAPISFEELIQVHSILIALT